MNDELRGQITRLIEAEQQRVDRYRAEQKVEAASKHDYARHVLTELMQTTVLPNSEAFEPKMKPELESMLRVRFAETTKKLARIAETPNMSPAILAFSTAIVLKLAMVMFGDKLALQFFGRVMKGLRVDRGICSCGEDFAKQDASICQKCWNEIESEERLLKDLFPET